MKIATLFNDFDLAQKQLGKKTWRVYPLDHLKSNCENVLGVVRGLLPQHQIEAFYNHDRLIQDLKEYQPDFVLNFANQGFYNDMHLDCVIPGILEGMGYRHSGADTHCISKTYDKYFTLIMAESAGIRVARPVLFRSVQELNWKEFPAFVRISMAENSSGISEGNVVYDSIGLMEAVKKIQEEWSYDGDFIIQKFLEGPDLTVGLLGDGNGGFKTSDVFSVRLPKSETDVLDSAAKTVSYLEDFEFQIAQIPDWHVHYIKGASLKLANMFGVRDICRPDWRMHKGEPYFLELNPNATWDSGGFAYAAFSKSRSPLSYQQFIASYIHSAFRWYGLEIFDKPFLT